MPAETRREQTFACNDNGAVAIGRAATAPRSVLTAAQASCPRLALVYLARGSLLLISAGAARPISAAA